MRFSFRREAKGRHALGAAVTAIPSAPVRVPVVVPVQAQSVEPVVDVLTAPAPVLPPVASPPAAVTPTAPPVPAPVLPPVAPPPPLAADPITAPARAPLPVDAVVSAPSLPVQPVDLEPALLDLLGAFDAPLPPSVVHAAAPSAVVEPPAAVVEAPVAAEPPAVVVAPLVTAEVLAPAPAPTGPRVELGFADGSIRMLDPASSAAQQLSDLVAQLTGKGVQPGPSAS